MLRLTRYVSVKHVLVWLNPAYYRITFEYLRFSVNTDDDSKYDYHVITNVFEILI